MPTTESVMGLVLAADTDTFDEQQYDNANFTRIAGHTHDNNGYGARVKTADTLRVTNGVFVDSGDLTITNGRIYDDGTGHSFFYDTINTRWSLSDQLYIAGQLTASALAITGAASVGTALSVGTDLTVTGRIYDVTSGHSFYYDTSNTRWALSDQLYVSGQVTASALSVSGTASILGTVQTGNAGVGIPPVSYQGLAVGGNISSNTGPGAVGYGAFIAPTLVAQADNATLYGVQIIPAFNDNGHVGVAHIGTWMSGGLQLTGTLGLGTPPVSNAAIVVAGTINSSSGAAFGINLTDQLVAQADNVPLYGLFMAPTFNDNGHAGVHHVSAYFNDIVQIGDFSNYSNKLYVNANVNQHAIFGLTGGGNGIYAGLFQSNGGTGLSNGVHIQAGTNSSDYSLRVLEIGGSDRFYVRGDGFAHFSNTLDVGGNIAANGGIVMGGNQGLTGNGYVQLIGPNVSIASLAAGVSPPSMLGGDIAAIRSGGNQGGLYFNSAGTRFLYWDGTEYNLPGANAIINGVPFPLSNAGGNASAVATGPVGNWTALTWVTVSAGQWLIIGTGQGYSNTGAGYMNLRINGSVQGVVAGANQNISAGLNLRCSMTCATLVSTAGETFTLEGMDLNTTGGHFDAAPGTRLQAVRIG